MSYCVALPNTIQWCHIDSLKLVTTEVFSMDGSLPDSSVHGILQARTLEWVAIPFSRVSSPPRDWTQVSCRLFHWGTLNLSLLHFPLFHVCESMLDFVYSWNTLWPCGTPASPGLAGACLWQPCWVASGDGGWSWLGRRLLRVPWTARRSNQSILKEIRPEDSVEGLMLKLQQFDHLMQTNWLHWERPWCWARLKAGGEGDDRGWAGC